MNGKKKKMLSKKKKKIRLKTNKKWIRFSRSFINLQPYHIQFYGISCPITTVKKIMRKLYVKNINLVWRHEKKIFIIIHVKL